MKYLRTLGVLVLICLIGLALGGCLDWQPDQQKIFIYTIPGNGDTILPGEFYDLTAYSEFPASEMEYKWKIERSGSEEEPEVHYGLRSFIYAREGGGWIKVTLEGLHKDCGVPYTDTLLVYVSEGPYIKLDVDPIEDMPPLGSKVYWVSADGLHVEPYWFNGDRPVSERRFWRVWIVDEYCPPGYSGEERHWWISGTGANWYRGFEITPEVGLQEIYLDIDPNGFPVDVGVRLEVDPYDRVEYEIRVP